MDTSDARAIRFLRLSLVWVGVALVGVVLLGTVFLGAWSTNCSYGPQLQNAPPQSCPPNPAPLIALGVSFAIIAGGLVGLGTVRRSHRRSLLGPQRTP
jgi:uncharacterized membrane protein YedE/YeeE